MELFEINFVLPHWMYWGGLVLIPLVFMAAVRRSRKALAEAHAMVSEHHKSSSEIEENISPESEYRTRLGRESRFVRVIDCISTAVGQFVAYWSPIAVFVYFYEVVVRYFFDSPTNWAHESMFLMFGMMYLLSGAYGLLHGAHVRVDLFYSRASQRGRAGLDIITFPFFMCFAGALVWTGWTFFTSVMDANQFFFATGYTNESSFTEWGVEYWPVKMTIFFGSLFLLLAGISELVKDIKVFRRPMDSSDKSA